MATSTQTHQLPEYFDDKIKNIGDNLAENFKRAFNNEGIRLRKIHKSIDLENVAFSADNIYVELSNIRMNYPEFRMSSLNVDLEQSIVSFKLSLGTFQFPSKMITITRTIFNGMYSNATANLLWTLHNIQIRGSIGLFRVGDSFVPQNHENFYYFDKGEIEQFGTEKQLPESTSFLNKDFSLFRIIQAEFYSKLSNLIKRQMNVITEFSAGELLLDEQDEIAKYDEYLNRRTLRANLLIDSVVNKAKTMGLFDDGETITTSFGLPYRQENSTTRHLLIAKGQITGMNTFSRLRDCSIYETNDTLRVYGELGLKDYKFNYNYTTEYDGFKFEGTISAKIYKNTWMIEIIKYINESPVVLLSVNQISDIEIDYSNLGSLMWLTKPLRTTLHGHIKMETYERVNSFLAERLQSAAFQLPSIISHRHVINKSAANEMQ